MSRLFYFLINHRENKVFGNLFTSLLKLLGLELPKKVKMGKNVSFPHLGGAIVIHPSTIIEDDVRIYHGVTIGRADPYNAINTDFKGVVIKKGAMLCPGAKILCKKGEVTIGENTIIGANAVITKSTGKNEIWAGIPAVKKGNRDC